MLFLFRASTRADTLYYFSMDGRGETVLKGRVVDLAKLEHQKSTKTVCHFNI